MKESLQLAEIHPYQEMFDKQVCPEAASQGILMYAEQNGLIL
jgi:hypothetical protein